MWSDKIESGKLAAGDIVAKFYKTGKKVTLKENVKQMVESVAVRTIQAQHDEYRLVITGKGELGEFTTETAWFGEFYQFILGNKDTAAVLGTTELIVSGEIECMENFQMTLSYYLMLDSLILEDIKINLTPEMDEEINLIKGNTILKRIVLSGDEIILDPLSLGRYMELETVVLDRISNISEMAFIQCYKLKNVILSNVVSIGDNAFRECTSLTNVKISNSLTSIGSNAFNQCSSLTSITIPNSVKSIGRGAFSECSSLIAVTIPDSIDTIEESTFWRCSSLTSITIPDSVTNIVEGAFDDCNNLKNIYYEGSEAQWNAITIGNNSMLTNTTIHYNSN